LFEGVGDILIGVAREFAVPRAANKDLAQRRPLAEWDLEASAASVPAN
jgi:hypothetical protein